MPAPKGNTNAATHGISHSRRLAMRGVRVRQLPKGLKYASAEATRYTRLVMAELESVREPSLADIATVQSIAAWFQHTMLVQKVLRQDWSTLSVDQKVKFSEEAAKGQSKVSDLVHRLKLDQAPAVDPWLLVTEQNPHMPQMDTEEQLNTAEKAPEAAQEGSESSWGEITPAEPESQETATQAHQDGMEN